MLNLSLWDNFIKGDNNASAHTVPVITVFSDSDPFLPIFDKISSINFKLLLLLHCNTSMYYENVILDKNTKKCIMMTLKYNI